MSVIGNKNALGNNGGRPTLYKEDYNEQAYKLCLLGAKDKDLADFFNVDEATINNWKIAHPVFFESISAGKQIADMEVANSLYKGAIDRVVPKQIAIKVKEVKYDENGKRISDKERVEVVEIEEFIPSDFRNAQFWLKNRNPERWRDKQELDHQSSDGTMTPKTTIVFSKPTDKE